MHLLSLVINCFSFLLAFSHGTIVSLDNNSYLPLIKISVSSTAFHLPNTTIVICVSLYIILSGNLCLSVTHFHIQQYHLFITAGYFFGFFSCEMPDVAAITSFCKHQS